MDPCSATCCWWPPRWPSQEGLTAWRTVINSGAEAGQTVFHLHVHVIGGRTLAMAAGVSNPWASLRCGRFSGENGPT